MPASVQPYQWIMLTMEFDKQKIGLCPRSLLLNSDSGKDNRARGVRQFQKRRACLERLPRKEVLKENLKAEGSPLGNVFRAYKTAGIMLEN